MSVQRTPSARPQLATTRSSDCCLVQSLRAHVFIQYISIYTLALKYALFRYIGPKVYIGANTIIPKNTDPGLEPLDLRGPRKQTEPKAQAKKSQ